MDTNDLTRWLWANWAKLSVKHNVSNTRDIPSYDVWVSALMELYRQETGREIVLRPGFTTGVCTQMVAKGVSPEQIKAVFTLVFLTQ